MAPYPHLFGAIRLGQRTARNRIMRLPTVPMLLDQGRIGDRSLAFYERLAAGGAGTIVTESFLVSPAASAAHGAIIASNGAGPMVATDPGCLPGLRRLADLAHRHGALIIGSLYHGGRQHLGRAAPSMVAPSAVACPQSGGIPHGLTQDEIADLVAAFGVAAAHCREAGMDGVEVHGAQGHLIQQFVSGFSNRRTDRYGGDLEGRTRFAHEILATVRARIGADAVLGYRMAVAEFTEGGITIEESECFAPRLVATGMDYLSLSQGNFNTNDTHIPDRLYPPATFRALHTRIRRVAGGVPVATCGRIETPEAAEAILAAGDADLIGLARPLLADPGWPAMAAAGGTIRGCIVCNKCWDTISEGRPVRCTVNPELGREHELGPLPPAAIRRRIVIVGGGPAGLEAARVAALRGHAVTLLERESAAGGKLRRAQLAPGHAELGRVVAALLPQALAAGADIRTGVTADVSCILAERPDAVILATGSTPALPALPGDGSVPLLGFDGVLAVHGRIVVMDEDGYAWGAAAAQAAAAAGRDVVLVSRFFEVLRELPSVSRISTLRALDLCGVELRPNTEVAGLEAGDVLVRHYRSGRPDRIRGVDALIWVGLQCAEDGLAAELRDAGIASVSVIGDAFAPRRLLTAIEEGHRAGRAA